VQNADWVGPFGTPTPQTMNVFEGVNGQAELWGEFVNDPQFQPTLLLSIRVSHGLINISI